MSVDTITEPRPFDFLLKGGRVIDPANGRDGLLDVGIAGKKIAAIAPNIPPDAASQVVDVTGLIVMPGIIDMHTHVYTYPPAPTSYVESMNADAHLFASGVTTTVDAGTAGWRNFSDFKTQCIDRAKVRILAFLNIAGDGMVDKECEQDTGDMYPKVAAAVAEAYSSLVVGIKTAHYWTRLPWDVAHPPWASVERAVEAGELCHMPVMVDFWPRPPERPYPDLILKKLRPGDIHTHVFAQQFPIIDSQGRVYEHMFQARSRGVIFDLGHGAGSFWFRNAVPAFQGGFVPDSISTDFHMGNVNGPVLSMLATMSKCLCMGMTLTEVILRSTVTPAREIGRPELGALSIGAEADVAVLNHLRGDFGYVDCGRAKMIGHEKLACRLTIRAGQIVYDPEGLSVPEWEHAPAAYWRMPELQG